MTTNEKVPVQEKECRHVAYLMDFSNATWKNTLCHAIGWYLVPILAIISKIRRKPIEFGVEIDRNN